MSKIQGRVGGNPVLDGGGTVSKQMSQTFRDQAAKSGIANHTEIIGGHSVTFHYIQKDANGGAWSAVEHDNVTGKDYYGTGKAQGQGNTMNLSG